MSTENINPEMLKQLKAQHQAWLSNPLTQMFLGGVRARLKKYDDALCEHIRQTSDKEFEDKYRSSITTCKAILQIAEDPNKFIEHSTKQ